MQVYCIYCFYMCVCFAVLWRNQTQNDAAGAAKDVHLSNGKLSIYNFITVFFFTSQPQNCTYFILNYNQHKLAFNCVTEVQLTCMLLVFICLYVQESERKAYNPRPFCKTYTMDKQPLNTGEQKDMTEFFTDLITKIEEMSQELVSTLPCPQIQIQSF